MPVYKDAKRLGANGLRAAPKPKDKFFVVATVRCLVADVFAMQVTLKSRQLV